MICPVQKTVWGPVNSLKDLNYAIAKSGQPFGVDWSGPACKVVPGAPCNITYYQYLGFGLHKGIDIPVATGTEVFATADGKVCEISDDITKGIGLVICHSGLKLKSLYWHLKAHCVNLGDIVTQGQIVGISDNTGYSEGPHLHFEIKTTDEHGISIKSVDPIPYISFTKSMSEDEVKHLYVLAFYRTPDADELAFWKDKQLCDFLKVAIQDRAKFLEQNSA